MLISKIQVSESFPNYDLDKDFAQLQQICLTESTEFFEIREDDKFFTKLLKKVVNLLLVIIVKICKFIQDTYRWICHLIGVNRTRYQGTFYIAELNMIANSGATVAIDFLEYKEVLNKGLDRLRRDLKIGKSTTDGSMNLAIQDLKFHHDDILFRFQRTRELSMPFDRCHLAVNTNTWTATNENAAIKDVLYTYENGLSKASYELNKLNKELANEPWPIHSYQHPSTVLQTFSRLWGEYCQYIHKDITTIRLAVKHAVTDMNRNKLKTNGWYYTNDGCHKER